MFSFDKGHIFVFISKDLILWWWQKTEIFFEKSLGMSLKKLWIYSHLFRMTSSSRATIFHTGGHNSSCAFLFWVMENVLFKVLLWNWGTYYSFHSIPEECQRSTLSYSKVKNANDDKFFHKWLDAATILKCSIILSSREKNDYKFRIFLNVKRFFFVLFCHNIGKSPNKLKNIIPF